MHSFSSEILFYIGPFKVTNTILNTLVVDAFILAFAYYISKNIRLIPGKIQNAVELVISMFYGIVRQTSQTHADKIFPYFISFFIFILIANWSGLVPGFTSIGIYGEHHELIPLLRGATSDINTTLALALVSVGATHIMSVRTLGVAEYLSRYFSLNPINLFVGILEIVSEVTKIVSLSFRLFGNIFAGEIALGTVSNIFAFAFPLPFLLLEILVGVVQALVFAMLTAVFMAILTTPHNPAHKEVKVD